MSNLKPINIEPVFEWIRRNSTDGFGPARSLYHGAAAANGLPSYSSLQLRKWTWPKLLEAAGVQPCPKGRPPIGSGAKYLRNHPGAVPLGLAAELERMEATAEPPQPRSWPLFGIPTRQETFTVRIDAETAIRCTRQYFSLR